MKPEAHESLFEAWMQQHIAILHRVVNGFADGADRNDLMQEVLLAVWKAMPSYRGDAQSATFIYRVSHNAAMTWRRGEMRYHQRRDTAETVLASPPSVEGSKQRLSKLQTLYRAIRKLPPLQRSLILLSLDGVSYREMATIHGLSESNVGARLTRARQRLAGILKEMHHEP